MISRFLGTDSLAAVGYFSPVIALISIMYVIILGTVILSGNFIGAGQRKKLNSLFTGSFISTLAVCTILALILMLFKSSWATFLGATADTATLLEDYIFGYAPGIIFSNLSALLLALTSYNNDIPRSYVAAVFLLISNVILDIILVYPLGIYGIALASTISSAVMFAILMPSFLNKNKTIHIDLSNIDFKLVLDAAGLGMPVLFFIQNFADKRIFNAFLTELKQNGIAYELCDEDVLELPQIELPWLQSKTF